jgi:predicted RNase H-like nuclease (RuvC/YqgF family)
VGPIGGWGHHKKGDGRMFNKQLRHNIKSLDAQIGELSKELEGLKKDTKYDSKIRMLSDLIGFRTQLAGKNEKDSKSDAIVELDRQIEELTKLVENLVSDEVYIAKMQKLEELTKVRCLLAEAKVKESNAPAIIGLVGSISGILLVLNYEKKDIITSKAIGIATKLFGGK